MKLLVANPWKDKDYEFDRILDTATGLVYEKTLGHPSGLTLEEAKVEERTFTIVEVYSLHGATNDYGELQSIKYEAQAADLLWETMKDNATVVNPGPESDPPKPWSKHRPPSKPIVDLDEIPY